MRALGPVPATRLKSTPSSRANLRTDGDACGTAPLALTSAAATAIGVGTGAGATDTATGAATAAGAEAETTSGAAPAAPSSTSIGVPSLTLSPTLIFTSFT